MPLVQSLAFALLAVFVAPPALRHGASFVRAALIDDRLAAPDALATNSPPPPTLLPAVLRVNLSRALREVDALVRLFERERDGLLHDSVSDMLHSVGPVFEDAVRMVEGAAYSYSTRILGAVLLVLGATWVMFAALRLLLGAVCCGCSRAPPAPPVYRPATKRPY